MNRSNSLKSYTHTQSPHAEILKLSNVMQSKSSTIFNFQFRVTIIIHTYHMHVRAQNEHKADAYNAPNNANQINTRGIQSVTILLHNGNYQKEKKNNKNLVPIIMLHMLVWCAQRHSSAHETIVCVYLREKGQCAFAGSLHGRAASFKWKFIWWHKVKWNMQLELIRF